MNCMNCGAFLVDKDLDYCPKCGCNVLIQKKVDYLSRQYYNRGLEKAFGRALEGKGDDGMLFCVGSLYLVGEIKDVIRRNKK